MAMRKATVKKQVEEAFAQQAPGERPLVTLAAITGPTPWLSSIGIIGLIVQFMMKFYLISVTEQGLVLHRMGRFSQRPKEIAYAIPRAQAQGLFGEVQLNPLWSVFRLSLPGEAKPVRVNVQRLWRNELEQLVSMLGGAAQGQPPGQQMPGPYPQQQEYPQHSGQAHRVPPLDPRQAPDYSALQPPQQVQPPQSPYQTPAQPAPSANLHIPDPRQLPYPQQQQGGN
jgi:hypothetical protein